MKVILTQHVNNLGEKGAILEVSEGYARNFLFPRKFAFPAGDPRASMIRDSVGASELKREKDQKKKVAAADKLRTHAFIFTRKASEQGTLYAGVTAAEIAQAVSDFLGVKIIPSKITLPVQVRTFGKHMAEITLGNQKIRITITVNPS